MRNNGLGIIGETANAAADLGEGGGSAKRRIATTDAANLNNSWCHWASTGLEHNVINVSRLVDRGCVEDRCSKWTFSMAWQSCSI